MPYPLRNFCRRAVCAEDVPETYPKNDGKATHSDTISRRSASSQPAVAPPLLEDAVAEIERLRNGALDARETVCQHVRGTVTQHRILNFTLTDEERGAIYRAESRLRTAYVPDDETAGTLRSLLERLA